MADLGTISRTASGAFVTPADSAVVGGRRDRSVLLLLHGRKTALFARVEGRRCGREENVRFVTSIGVFVMLVMLLHVRPKESAPFAVGDAMLKYAIFPFASPPCSLVELLVLTAGYVQVITTIRSNQWRGPE
jgi:hypothetical protein